MSDTKLDAFVERIYLATHPTREQIRAALADAVADERKALRVLLHTHTNLLSGQINALLAALDTREAEQAQPPA